MVKFTTVQNGEIVTREISKEQFRELMKTLKKRAKRNVMKKKWNGGV